MQKKPLVLLALTLCLAVSFTYYFISKNQSDKLDVIHEKALKDRPDLAAEQEFEMTKDPSLGYPPVERKISAFKEAQKLLRINKGAKAIENVVWQERGPNNVGGRTRALIWDPNDPAGKKVFSGTVAGGLWYNNDITDTDSEWQNIDDFMANLAISTLAYDPNNTQTFYAGTGLGFTGRLRGAGIWKSIDGGTSWVQLASTSNDGFYFNQKIVVTSTSRVVVATDDGLKISDDAGENWTDVIASTDMADVEVEDDGINGEVLYASGFDGNIYKSTDNGDNWTDISPGDVGDRVELAIAPSDVNTVYAVAAQGSNVGWFKKSTDGGDTWEDITIPLYLEQGSCEGESNDFTRGQAWFDLILAVFPNDPNSVIAGGIDLHRTTDGGTSWESLSYWTGACDDYVHADQHAIVFKDGSDNEAIFGNDGGVFYSNELDQPDPNFEETINEYNTALFYATAINNVATSNIYLAGAQDNGSHLFTSLGINSSIEVTGGDGAYCFIDQDEPNIMITSYVYNNYYISTDGGVTFGTLSSDNFGNFINQADYDDKANILYASADDNEIARYSNITSGSPTQEVRSISVGGEQLSHVRVSPYTENRVFVGTEGGGVYVLDNADATPSVNNIDNGQLPIGNVSCIEIGESDDHLIVTYSNYGLVSVWETIDGGETWSNKESNLPDMPVRWALFNPNNTSEVLLATDVGIWSTDEFDLENPVWEPTTEGLANVRCDMLQYRSSDNQVVVATFGRGLYTSDIFIKGTYPGFEADKTITYIGDSITFSNTSTGEVSNQKWLFGDGNTSDLSKPKYTYEAPGKYDVTLELNDNEYNLKKESQIKILPNRSANYGVASGGSFEVYMEDFIADNISGTGFALGSSTVVGKDGTASGSNAWVTGLEEEEYSDNSIAILYTPHFDFSAVGTYELSFKTKYSFEDNWDGFIVQYTLDSGKTWNKLNNNVENGWYNQISDVQSVWGPSEPIFSGSTAGVFETMSTDVSFLGENGRVGFRFLFRTDAAVVDIGMAIDDFNLVGPTKDATADFVANPKTLSICNNGEVTFFDNSTGDIDINSYAWDFGTGATPATATGRGPHTVTYSTVTSPSVSLTIDGTSNGTVSVTKTDFINISDNIITDKVVGTNNTEICSGESADIFVENTDLDFKYQLYSAATDGPVGSFQLGNNATLTFNTGVIDQTSDFYFVVEDLNSPCTKSIDEFISVTVNPPAPKAIETLEESVCSGSAASFTVLNSDLDVEYFLINSSTGDVISEIFIGDGEDLILESNNLTDTISIQIKAESSVNSCSLILNEPVEIAVKELPISTITADDFNLYAPEGADKYVWFLDGDVLSGEDTRLIEAKSFGEYTVEIEVNGCTALSEPFTPTVLGVEELIEAGELSFYPNPTRGAVNLNQKGLFNYLKVYDYNGRVVESRNIMNNEVISLHQYNDGTYLFELSGPSKHATFRINKLD